MPNEVRKYAKSLHPKLPKFFDVLDAELEEESKKRGAPYTSWDKVTLNDYYRNRIKCFAVTIKKLWGEDR